MLSWENPDDRLAIVQMNAELRHAQLELLTAQCTTNQLRLRFSTADLARYAQRDILRKAMDTASGLHDYYSSIQKQIPGEAAISPAGAGKLGDEEIVQGAAQVLAYLREQRNRYFGAATDLSPQQKTSMRPFFSSGLLDRTRITELNGFPLEDPAFYAEAAALGLVNLPQLGRMASLTFLDVVVFNQAITERALFHGLVQAVQFQILGPERYTELFVAGFLRTGSHIAVPLEVHAASLDARFSENRADSFSVEEQVRLWIREG